MNAKPVVPRERARRDAEEAIGYYAQDAGAETALGFIDALEKSYRAIAENPRIGSPRYAHELNMPQLRHRPLGRFPYLVFYVERDEHIEVWRVLDGRRDIPAWLLGPE